MADDQVAIVNMSQEEYLSYKFGLLFDYLDVNRDGILDWAELMTFPDNLDKAGKTEHAQRVRNVYDDAWRFINQLHQRPDAKNGISKEEWVRGNLALREAGWFERKFIPVFREVYFDWIDVDHDGYISLMEWREYNQKRGMKDEEFVISTFSKLDKNGDGRISRDELSNAISEFNVGVDPNQDCSFLYKTYK